MPEGHVIHRLAASLDEHFAGEPVQVTSPQGRFADEAALVDGHELDAAEAHGKHLFIRFDQAPDLPDTIHVHLGLIGKLRVEPYVPVTGAVRLRITDGTTVADLRGPQTCALVDARQVAAVRARLGPDPLRSDADPEQGFARLHASTKPVAALLMDQQVAAGVGNIYRAEVLFRHRIDPATPGAAIERATWQAMWDDLVTLMHEGVELGRIDTVTDDHTPEAMGRAPRVDRHGGEVYVYRRAEQPCLVCGTPVRTEVLAGRHLYWCPTCQTSRG